jgi:hypothetical protein
MGTVHRPCDSGLRHRLKYAGKQDIPGQASSAKHLTTAGQYADATASSQPQRALDFVASRTSQAAADIDMRLSAISPFSWPLCVSKIHPSGDFRDAKSQSTAAPNFPSVPLSSPAKPPTVPLSTPAKPPSVPLSSPPKPSTVPLSTPRKPPSVLILLRPVLRSKVPDTFYPNHAPPPRPHRLLDPNRYARRTDCRSGRAEGLCCPLQYPPAFQAFGGPLFLGLVELGHRRDTRRQDDPGLFRFGENVDIGR